MTITAHTRVAAVIGWPVEHSRSPALHNAAFAASGIDGVYTAAAVEPGALEAAVTGMRALGYLGASVTVPHKEAVVALCDRLVGPAARLEAVNCLVFGEDGVIGHNTDAGGYTDALAEAGVAVQGARAVLLGSGGAARAVAAGLEDAGSARVTVIARTPSKATWTDARPWTAESLETAMDGCDLLVDCTSAALAPATERDLPAPIPLDRLPPGATVSSLVYHRTPALLADAEARGLRTIDGAGMLVHQGARAFTLWTGSEAPIEAMWAALRSSLRDSA
jgi:shikimate dehydrogenase